VIEAENGKGEKKKVKGSRIKERPVSRRDAEGTEVGLFFIAV
jgi:hypothetical protein